MNIHRKITRLHDSSQMEQSIESAIRELEEWDYKNEDVNRCVRLAVKTLETAKNILSKEVNRLQDDIAGGELDCDQALQEE